MKVMNTLNCLRRVDVSFEYVQNSYLHKKHYVPTLICTISSKKQFKHNILSLTKKLHVLTISK